MANVKNVWVLLAGMVLLTATGAHAQATTPATQKFFVNVNFGVQIPDRTVGASAAQIVYEETATLTSTQHVNRGPLFDVGGGYRVWGDVFVGVSLSWFSDTEEAEWTASIPDPLFFNRPRSTTGTTGDLKRSERGTNVFGGWAFPLSDKLDMTAAVGVSIIKLKQDLVGNFSVATGTQTVTTTSTTEEATAKGLFAQIDFIYNLMERVGVGGYARYAGGKGDLTTLKAHNVGGTQAGGGLRLRF